MKNPNARPWRSGTVKSISMVMCALLWAHEARAQVVEPEDAPRDGRGATQDPVAMVNALAPDGGNVPTPRCRRAFAERFTRSVAATVAQPLEATHGAAPWIRQLGAVMARGESIARMRRIVDDLRYEYPDDEVVESLEQFIRLVEAELYADAGEVLAGMVTALDDGDEDGAVRRRLLAAARAEARRGRCP